MTEQELSNLSDEELLDHAKKNKPSPIFDAFFIGFLIGILIFGFLADGLGFLAIIPLFLIYLFLKKPKQQAAIKQEMEKRKLS